MVTLSIVTPTYNRLNKICRSIYSSLALIHQGFAVELIVVDDASTDATYEYLNKKFSNEIQDGIIKLLRLDVNVGVTGAKNVGAKVASGDYIAFMDSDDFFTDNAGEIISSVFLSQGGMAIYFFRCIDSESGVLIGEEADSKVVNLKYVINGGVPGECLPVVLREAISLCPYPDNLRGCESLAYYEILSSFREKAYISELICRNYEISGDDRLSSLSNRKKRAEKLIIYNFCILRYWKFLSFKNRIKTSIRIIYYIALSLSSKLKW